MPVLDVIDRLEAAIHTIQKMGIDVRREWFVPGASGMCRLGKQHLLILDQSLGPLEQIDVIQSALAELEQPPRKAA
jgi:hypothetical protein